MPADSLSALRRAARFLAGTQPSTLPPQRGLWGRVRTALAFQPARPVPALRPTPQAAAHQPVHPMPGSLAAWPAPPPSPPAPTASDPAGIRRAIDTLSPGRRLALRRHPAIEVATVGPAMVQLINDAISHSRNLTSALDRARDLALDRARDLGLDFALDHELDVARASARVLARDVGIVRDIALGIDFDHDLAHIRALVRALDLALARASAVDRAFARDRIRARDLNFDLALDRYRALHQDLDFALVQALDLAHGSTGLFDGLAAEVLGLDPAEGRGVGVLLADRGLDDFTTADLADVTLAGVPLDGIYWSVWGTRWPPGFDSERLKAESREVDPGSGIYLVEGTSTSDASAPSRL